MTHWFDELATGNRQEALRIVNDTGIERATVLVHESARFSAKHTLADLRDQAVSTFCAPPTVWRMLALEPLGDRPPALRELASAGEPLNPEIIGAFVQAWGITIRDGYGQTETTAMIGNSPSLPVTPGSMGKPLPGYDMVLLDADGRECDEGEVAVKLLPRPMGLMQGYVRKIRRVELRRREADQRARGDRGQLEFWLDDK